MYATLLDASKAFDLVSLEKLFQILEKKGLPYSVMRLLIDMYQRQRVRTIWNGEVSDFFSSSNGVRQGGVLSPILFTVYIDVLLQRLEASQIGCVVGGEYLGVLGYADDVTLLAPTVDALKSMLQMCETFGREFDISYNPRKTVCIQFKRKGANNATPNVSLNGTQLQWQNTVKHLGSFVSQNMREEHEIKAKQGNFIGSVNGLRSNFGTAEPEVLVEIFNRQCCHFYGCETWSLADKNLSSMFTSWRKGCRKVWNLPNTARSKLLPVLMRSPSPEVQVMRRFATMFNSMMKGHNQKLSNLLGISINSSNRGFIARNVSWISARWRCGFCFLQDNSRHVGDTDAVARAEAIRELTRCQNGQMILHHLDNSELIDMRNFISKF